MKKQIDHIIISLLLIYGGGNVLAQSHTEKSGHSHASAEKHGGSVTMTKYQHFETVFSEDEIRVYVYTGGQKPINELGENISGKIELIWKGGIRVNVPLRYIAPDTKSQRTQGYLSGKYDFSDVKKNKIKATISIEGLSHKKEPQVSFRQAVKLTAGGATEKQEEESHDSHEHEHEHEHEH